MAGLAGAGGELTGGRIGVFGVDVVGNNDVVADGQVVVAHRLTLDRDADHRVGCGHRTADRRAETEFHLCFPLNSERIGQQRMRLIRIIRH